MSYNSYNAALKSYEENGPSGKEGKNALVYSSDRTMKQHSALGATCNFKSAASICVMDFESCKWKWNRPNKNSCERSDIKVPCVHYQQRAKTSQQRTNESPPTQMLHLLPENPRLRIHDQKVIPPFPGTVVSVGNEPHQYWESNECVFRWFKAFLCSSPSNTTDAALIASFFLPQNAHRVFTTHHTSLDLVGSGVVFNLSTCLRSFLLHQH